MSGRGAHRLLVPGEAQAAGGGGGGGGEGAGMGVDGGGEEPRPRYPPRPTKLRRLAAGRGQEDAGEGVAEGRAGGRQEEAGDAGGGGGGGGASAAVAVASAVVGVAAPAAAGAAAVARSHVCPFCTAVHMATDEGLARLARHMASRHVGVKVERTHVRWFAGKLDKCECGRWSRIGGQCDCGSEALRSAIRVGDVVQGTAARRPVQVSSAARAQVRAASAAAIGDYGLPEAETWRASLDVEALREVAEELGRWSGSETTVHLPVRLRPELAEVVAVLLEGMVDGSEAASLMMQCLPKLLFHQNAIRKRGAHAVIRQRLTMLMQNNVKELANMVRMERAAADRVGAKRRQDGSGSNVGKVKELARDGALSKAVRRLDGLVIQRYGEDEARRWANELIPGTTREQRALGARGVTSGERAKLGALKTCAERVWAGTEQQEEAASEEDEEGEAEPRGRKKGRARPKINGYAEGVRFAALSAPGPSGLRPEHLREMAMSRRARSRHLFERAMGRFVAAGIRGQLPAAAWWITESAVTFVRKPGADDNAAPRPLRVGETLRRWIAKRIVAAEREGMRKVFARRRQFGVACPGGAEVLLHHRMITCGGVIAGMGDWDVDLKNCYGNLFWDSIDASVEKHIPGALPWTRWLHSRASRVILPDGVIHESDRGAEQGDPLGAAYAAAVIADVCERAELMALGLKRGMTGMDYGPALAAQGLTAAFDRAKEEVSEARAAVIEQRKRALSTMMEGAGVVMDVGGWQGVRVDEPDKLRLIDGWYIDDGHARADLVDGDLWLMAFDACGAGSGIIRSDTKSLFAAPAPDTATPPYTTATCRRREEGSAVKYLGVMIGGEDAQFRAKVGGMERLHEKIRTLNDPALELLLTRHCADAGKVMNLLRAVGPGMAGRNGLTTEALEQMDTTMSAAVAGIVRMEMTGEAAQQAAWNVRHGGLGMRPGSLLALPAHVAALVEARPTVAWLADTAASRGVPIVHDIDEVVGAARDLLTAGPLAVGLKERMRRSVEDAEESGLKRAGATLGLEVEEERGRGAPRGGGVADEAVADGEAEEGGGGGKMRLQERLVSAIEREQVDAVLRSLEGSRHEPDVMRRRRLVDLGNAGTKHGWMTAVNPAHGPVLRDHQFVTCLRLRLGLAVEPYDGAEKCSACGREYDAMSMGVHALCCAKGQSTKGHNRVRDHLASLAKVSDGRTSIEQKVGGGVDAERENWRPADILTSASPFGGVGLAALDIGISCPLATTAREGADVVEEYRRTKIGKYKQIADRAGWQYHPVTMSCFGRPHPESIGLVRRLAQAAARKYGVEEVGRIEERWWKNCSTLLAERIANMVMTCSPTTRLPAELGGWRESDEDEGVEEGGGGGEVVDVSAVVSGGGVDPPQ